MGCNPNKKYKVTPAILTDVEQGLKPAEKTHHLESPGKALTDSLGTRLPGGRMPLQRQAERPVVAFKVGAVFPDHSFDGGIF